MSEIIEELPINEIAQEIEEVKASLRQRIAIRGI